MPTVSVVLCVFNQSEYLTEAIESILKQTFTDFEFIIVNDGSTDDSQKIIDSYDDPRIVTIKNSRNLGLSISKNMAHKLAKGNYIVACDGDDWNDKSRLQKQVNFMNENPDIDISGTNFAHIGTGKIIQKPRNDEEIIIALLEGCSICHGSTIFRKSSMEKYNLFYDENVLASVDYDLYSRCADILKLGNLQEVLYNYRMHRNQMTFYMSSKQVQFGDKVRNRELNRIIPQRTRDESEIHCKICRKDFAGIENDFEKSKRWLDRLLRANQESGCYDEKLFEKFVNRLKGNVIKAYCDSRFVLAKKYNLKLLKEYFSSPQNAFKVYNFKVTFGIVVKCFIQYKRTK
ncbi:MAG: glycosyltransferase [Melioribacteraceae bacterium]|nr:glycosyltransferase [Melioribacteraceae bacterium]